MEKARGIVVVVLLCLVVVMELPEASATRYTVGGNMGWTSNVNYTLWAQDNSDPLNFCFFCQFFVYERNQKDVLEVNQTNYVRAMLKIPFHNWSTGAGRDLVPLNEPRHYYFISSNGFCYGGMKIAVEVENMP
ncbi:early nodulin-like protein 16 [Pyrus communis]|uniref:early nodulin-like protein 16 n=1 Tax=Pyrus communis TaxID=23211 RepID=UPI0035C0338A